jgi:membrane protein YdbS with pleckstrin-like domain
MYTLFRNLALRIMKAPTKPPDPPAGTGSDVLVYRASPKFLTYRMLGFWIIFSFLWMVEAVLILAGIVTGEGPPILIGLIAMPILALAQLCMYFEYRIDYDMRYYIVTDRSLRVREGAFVVKEKTISYANIQNIGIVQGPLQRLFGISNLKVDTAGGGSSEKGQPGSNTHHVQMAGIENAKEVRDLMRGYLAARGGGAGLGDLDDSRDHGSLTTMESPSLIEALRELRQATSALRSAAEDRG